MPLSTCDQARLGKKAHVYIHMFLDSYVMYTIFMSHIRKRLHHSALIKRIKPISYAVSTLSNHLEQKSIIILAHMRYFATRLKQLRFYYWLTAYAHSKLRTCQSQ